MKKLNLILAILILATASQSFAVDLIYKVFNEGINGGDHGSTSGSDNDLLTVKFYVPNGSADGNYTMRTSQYGNVFTVTVSGGISNYPDAAHARILLFYATDLLAYYSGATATMDIVKPDGSTVGGFTAHGVDQGTQYNASIVSESAKTGGRFRNTEKGPLNVTTAAPIKHPQPLDVNIKNTMAVSASILIKSPAGAIVYTGSAGKGQTLVGGYNPADDAPLGSYKVVAAYLDKNGNVIENLPHELTTAVLSASDGASEYSKVWSFPEVDATLSGGIDPKTALPNGSLTNNDTVPHILQWKDAAGNNVGGAITLAPGQSVATDASGLNVADVPGNPTSTGDFTLVDTTSGGNKSLGKVTVTRLADGGVTSREGNITATFNPPPGSPPSPTTTPTNTGNTSTGTQTNNPATSTANTTVNNPGSTNVTNQDIYNDIKTAMKDATSTDSPGTSSSRINTGAQPDGIGGHQGDAIQSKVTDSLSKQSDALTNMTSKLTSFAPGGAKTLALPSSLGTKMEWSPSLPILGEVHVDISPYSGSITALRVACLMVLSIIVFFASIKVIRSAVA